MFSLVLPRKINSDQINRSRHSAMAEDFSVIFSMETYQSNVTICQTRERVTSPSDIH